MRDMEQDSARILGVAAAGDQALLLHVVDQAGQRGDFDRGGVGQVAHAPAVLLTQRCQHAPDLQSGAEWPHFLAEGSGDARAGAVQEIGKI
jgi:hypothetical protein